MFSKCEHSYPRCEFTGKCICRDLDYWKTYANGVGRGKSTPVEMCEQFRPRERRLYDVNNASNFGASRNFKTKELVLEAYIATSKLYLPYNVLQEWFGPGGRMVDQVSSSDASTSRNVPPAHANGDVRQDYVLPPPVKLPKPRSPPPVQPTPKKGVNFSQIPSPQVFAPQEKTSQASGARRITPILKKATPLPIGVVLLGDSTLSPENII